MSTSGSEINKQDIITDDALQAPLILSQNLDKAVASMDAFIAKSKQVSATFSSGNIQQAKKDNNDLTESEIQLTKVHQQIAVAVAKNNELYTANTIALQKVKDQLQQNKATADQSYLLANQQNSSLNNLEKALNNNRVAYANLRSEQERGTTSGKKLLETIQQQYTSVTNLRATLGQFKNEAAITSKEITEGLASSLEAVASRSGQAGESLGKLGGAAINSIGLVKGLATGMGGLIAAFGALAAVSLSSFFTRTETGYKALLTAQSTLEFNYHQFLNTLAEIPQALLDSGAIRVKKDTDAQSKAYTELAFHIEDLIKQRIELSKLEADSQVTASKLLADANDRVNKTDTQRLDSLHKLDTLLDNISSKAVDQAQAEYDAQLKKLLIDKNVHDISELLYEDQVKLLPFYKAIDDAREILFQNSRRRISLESQINEEIFNRTQQLEKNTLAAQVGYNSARLQNDIETQAAILANQKSTEEQRLAALRKTFNDQINLSSNERRIQEQAAQQAAVQRARQNIGASVFESFGDQQKQDVLGRDELLQAQLLEIDQQFKNKRLTLTNTLLQNETDLYNQFLKIRLDQELKLYNAQKDFEASRLNDEVTAQTKITQDATVGIPAQIAAQKKITEAQIGLVQIKHDKDIAAAIDETAKLDAENGRVYDNIIALADKIKALDQQQQADTDKLLLEGGTKAAEIIDTDYQNRVKEVQNGNKAILDAEQKALNQRFLSGVIGLREYNGQTQNLQRNYEQKNLIDSIDIYTQELTELKKYLDEKKELTEAEAKLLNAVNQQINDNQAKLDEKSIQQRTKALEQQRALIQQFSQAVLSSTKQIGDENYQYQQNQIQAQISALQTQEQTELTSAGDNANAKLQITQQFNQKIADENQKLRKVQHDQAVFDRDIALAEIALKTAQAIAAVLPLLSNPITAGIGTADIALISGIGAVEAAAVIAKPIPAYYKGVKNSQEGLARVGDRGPELVLDGKSGGAQFFDKDTVTYLTKDSTVFTADETRQIRNGQFNAQLSSLAVNRYGELVQEQSFAKVEKKLEKLINVVKNKKELHINITSKGMEKLIKQSNSWNKVLGTFYNQ